MCFFESYHRKQLEQHKSRFLSQLLPSSQSPFLGCLFHSVSPRMLQEGRLPPVPGALPVGDASVFERSVFLLLPCQICITCHRSEAWGLEIVSVFSVFSLVHSTMPQQNICRPTNNCCKLLEKQAMEYTLDTVD